MTAPSSPPPGWYDDPENANAQRYWDGQDSSPHRQRKPISQPMPPTVTPTAPPPSYGGPPRPSTAQSPITTKGRSGRSNVGFIIAGLALVLFVAALVTSRVMLGTFLPGILSLAVIAIVGVTLTVRSRQGRTRKAILVTAMTLVVAVAIPASMKVVYPLYSRFFTDSSAQTSRSAQGSPSSRPRSTAPTGSPDAGSGQYKIVVAGQDITGQGSDVDCRLQQTSEGNNIFKIMTRAGEADLKDNKSDLISVNLSDSSSHNWAMVDGYGNNSLTKNGNVYTITGTVRLIMHPPGDQGDDPTPTGGPLPFEFDATCPQ